MSKTFPEKIDKKFDVSFFSIFLFYRIFECFSAMGVQKHYRKRFSTKKRVEKFLQNNRQKTKESKTDFFYDFFNRVFGRFSVRGVQKHDKKNIEKNLTLVRFWPLTHPPTTGVTDFFFAGPLKKKRPDIVGDRRAEREI
jgi:hypothetical protein